MNLAFQTFRQPIKNVYLALDIDLRSTTAAFVSKDGAILEKKIFTNNPNDDLSYRCVSPAEEIIRLCAINQYAPIAVGVSTKGNVKNGFVTENRNNQRAIDLKGILERKFGLQTEVLNRFHATALGVNQVLNNCNDTSLAVINVSNGVGYGVVQKGKILEVYDRDKGAGGLRIVERLSDRKWMSVASIAGSEAIKARAKEFFGKYQSVGEIFKLAKTNSRAAEILDDAADALAELVSDLDESYRPRKIVSIFYSKEECLEVDKLNFLKKVKRKAERKIRFPINIDLSEINELDAKLIGAAQIAMQRLKDCVNESLFVITGEPTCGKTTFVAKTLVGELKRQGIKVGGITCHETRGLRGGRTGFSMNLLSASESDRSIELARVGAVEEGNWRPFTRFSVNLKNINDFAVPTLKNAMINAEVIIIDEIASMQLLSEQFSDTVEEILNLNKPTVVTVPIHCSKHGIIDRIKQRAKKNNLLFTLNAKDRQKSQNSAYNSILPLLTKQRLNKSTYEGNLKTKISRQQPQIKQQRPTISNQPVLQDNKRKRSEDLFKSEFPQAKMQKKGEHTHD